MVAPVVIITLAAIFANGLLTGGATVAGCISELNQQRLDILGGPHGEILDENSVPPISRERLTQIRDQMPLLIRRSRGIRRAVLIAWIATGVAHAQRGRHRGRRHGALGGLRVHGAGPGHGRGGLRVRCHCHGDHPLARSADPAVKEAKRTGMLG